MYKLTLEYLVVPDSKEAIEDDWVCVKSPLAKDRQFEHR